MTVVEASSELVAAAGARLGGRARFITGAFETVTLPQRYDAIFLIHTLEHLDDPVGVLRRVNNWLTPSRTVVHRSAERQRRVEADCRRDGA